MDIKLAILGAILIAMCIIPIILIIRSGKKVERHLIQSLKKIANQYGCKISLHETFGEQIIGIDEIKKYVFFYKKSNDNITSQVIELSNYQSCKVIKTKRALKGNNGNFSGIEKLELFFEPMSKEMNSISLEFSNVNDSNLLTDEIQLVEKWSNLINEKLKK